MWQYKTVINRLIYILIVMLFLHILLTSLVIGGRWDLNEQIAFGNRLINGSITYANGINDLLFPSSPYFPGVGLSSAFLSWIGIDNIFLNNQLMLVIAVVIGFFYFILLKKITHKLYPEISNIVILFCLSIFFMTHFRSYILYMSEFKPDTILLVIATSIFLIFDKDKVNIKKSMLFMGLMLFISAFFKQYFFIIYFLVLLLTIFSEFTLKQKVFLVVFYTLMILCALKLIFSINNLYYFTIKVMSQHPFLKIRLILSFLKLVLIQNFIFIPALLLFVLRSARMSARVNYFKSQRTEYFVFAIFWFLISLMAMCKAGGNTGNFEVGMIVFMPCIISYINSVTKAYHTSTMVRIGMMLFILFSIFYYIIKNVRDYKLFADNVQNISTSSNYIEGHFKNKNAFVDGNTYIMTRLAKVNVISEAETISHFNNVHNYDMSRIINAFKSKVYDLVIINQDLNYNDKRILEALNENYKILVDPIMPKYLNNKILVPKYESK